MDLDREGLKKRSEALSEIAPGHVTTWACDLAAEDSARFAVERAIDLWGGLDILIHCAALVGTSALEGWAVPFPEQRVAAWRAALDVNLTAAFVMAQAAEPALRASGHGAMVFFSSIYGLVGPDDRLYVDTPMGNPAAYGVSKAGLLQLTRYLATTLAPEIRVNAISPGGVWASQPEAFVARYLARTPMQRMANAEDVKGAIAYLCSDLSAYVTGQNLVVDGGWTAW